MGVGARISGVFKAIGRWLGLARDPEREAFLPEESGAPDELAEWASQSLDGDSETSLDGATGSEPAAGSAVPSAEAISRPPGMELTDRERAMDQAHERWERLLRMARMEASKVAASLRALPALHQVEREIEPSRERQFLDTLLIRKLTAELSIAQPMLDESSLNRFLSAKLPSLSTWARGESSESDLTRERNEVALEWARQSGALRQQGLAEGLMAEAIEAGSSENARLELAAAGRERLDTGEARRIISAIAERKDGGLSEGMGEDSLEAIASAMGGLGALAEALEGLSGPELVAAIFDLIRALKDSASAEMALLAARQRIASSKARQRLEQAIGSAASALNRSQLLTQVLAGSDRNLSTLLTERHKIAPISKDGKAFITQSATGLTLADIAWASKAGASEQTLQDLGAAALGRERKMEIARMVADRASLARDPGSREALERWAKSLARDPAMDTFGQLAQARSARAQPASKAAPAIDPKAPKN